MNSPANEYGLYIHIPWCVKKCPYCDFNSHEKNASYDEAAYVQALLDDLAFESSRVEGRQLSSIFFGGGTPSLFSASSIASILEAVKEQLNCTKTLEITLEANPGTAEADKFEGFYQAGVNRLSIGVQSFNDEHLLSLGRVHNAKQAHQAIEMAQSAGFKRINLDLMFGLPQQTSQQALADVKSALAYKTGHLSYYQLSLEKNTLFHKHPPNLPNEEQLWEIQTQCQQEIGQTLSQYEISAYAADKQHAQHNINYWNFGDYIGIGAGAHGKLTDKQGTISRRWKQKQPQQFIQTAGTADCLGGQQTLEKAALPFEFMLNALRLKKGFTEQRYQQQTGLKLSSLQPLLDELTQKGLLENSGQYIHCTTLGWNFLNETLERFLNG